MNLTIKLVLWIAFIVGFIWLMTQAFINEIVPRVEENPVEVPASPVLPDVKG